MLQRIVLLSHNKDSDTVSLRHYCISLTPAGLTKGIKALVTTKVAPDLSQFSSVADFVERAGYASDSDVDDTARVASSHADRGQASRVRLHEVRALLGFWFYHFRTDAFVSWVAAVSVCEVGVVKAENSTWRAQAFQRQSMRRPWQCVCMPAAVVTAMHAIQQPAIAKTQTPTQAEVLCLWDHKKHRDRVCV